MAWPTTIVDTTNVANAGQSPSAARADIKQCFETVNAMLAALGQPGGPASLGTDGKIPQGQLSGPSLISAMAAVDGVGSGLDADALGGELYTAYMRVDASRSFSFAPTATAGVQFRLTSNSADLEYTVATLAHLSTVNAVQGFGFNVALRLTNGGGTEKTAGFITCNWETATADAEVASIALRTLTDGVDGFQEQVRFSAGHVQLPIIETPSGNPEEGAGWLYYKSGGLWGKLHDGTEVEFIATGSGTLDHAQLTNRDALSAHTGYLDLGGTRAMTGDLQLGAHAAVLSDVVSHPAAPASGKGKLYVLADQLYMRVSGSIIGPFSTGGVTAHNQLSGLTQDDHAQYAILNPLTKTRNTFNVSSADCDFAVWGLDGATVAFAVDADATDFGQAVFINANIGTTPLGRLHVAGVARTGIYASTTSTDALPALWAKTTGTGAAIKGTSEEAGSAAVFERVQATDAQPISAVVEITEHEELLGGREALVVRQRNVVGTVVLFYRDNTDTEIFKIDESAITLNGGAGAINVRMAGYGEGLDNLFLLDATANCVNINSAASSGRLTVDGAGIVGLSVVSTGAAEGTASVEFSTDKARALHAITVDSGGLGVAIEATANTGVMLLATRLAAGTTAGLQIDHTHSGDSGTLLDLHTAGTGALIDAVVDNERVFAVQNYGGLTLRILANDFDPAFVDYCTTIWAEENGRFLAKPSGAPTVRFVTIEHDVPFETTNVGGVLVHSGGGYFTVTTIAVPNWGTGNVEILAATPLGMDPATGGKLHIDSNPIRVLNPTGATYTCALAFPVGAIPIGATIYIKGAPSGVSSISVGDGTTEDRWAHLIPNAADGTTTSANFKAGEPLLPLPDGGDVVLTPNAAFAGDGDIYVTTHYFWLEGAHTAP